MKNLLWLGIGVAVAVAGFLVWGSAQERPVEALAHSLEEAWADHHTTV